jgi:hypothetical protein
MAALVKEINTLNCWSSDIIDRVKVPDGMAEDAAIEHQAKALQRIYFQQHRFDFDAKYMCEVQRKKSIVWVEMPTEFATDNGGGSMASNGEGERHDEILRLALKRKVSDNSNSEERASREVLGAGPTGAEMENLAYPQSEEVDNQVQPTKKQRIDTTRLVV